MYWRNKNINLWLRFWPKNADPHVKLWCNDTLYVSYTSMIPFMSRILQLYPFCLVYFNAGFRLSDDTTVSVQSEHSFYLGCSAGSIVSSIDSLRLLVHSVDMWDDRAVTKLLLDVFALLNFSKLSPMCSIHSRSLAMIL